MGFTIQAGDTKGVVRVLSESPIRSLDFPEVDDSTIDRFRTVVVRSRGSRHRSKPTSQGNNSRVLQLELYDAKPKALPAKCH